MHTMTKFLKSSLIMTIALIAFSITIVNAQTDPPPDDPSGSDPALPVDGGLSLLLAAGAAYGGRRVYRLQQSAKKDSAGE